MSKKSGIPSGTETKDWLESSARIAWTLWRIKRSQTNPKEPQEERLKAWEAEATKFREYVRQALRALYSENIKIEKIPPSLVLHDSTKGWMEKSARTAWIFWLIYLQKFSGTSPEDALTQWENHSTEYRKYIRSALKELLKENIGIRAF